MTSRDVAVYRYHGIFETAYYRRTFPNTAHLQLDLRSTGRGFKSYSEQKLRNNPGQVVHTYVPLSPSSITWYRLSGGDALRLGR